jgi:hypothetical protein
MQLTVPPSLRDRHHLTRSCLKYSGPSFAGLLTSVLTGLVDVLAEDNNNLD